MSFRIIVRLGWDQFWDYVEMFFGYVFNGIRLLVLVNLHCNHIIMKGMRFVREKFPRCERTFLKRDPEGNEFYMGTSFALRAPFCSL